MAENESNDGIPRLPPTVLPSAITSESEAVAWLEQLTLDAVAARDLCNVYFPDDKERTAREQRNAWQKFLTRYGCLLGATAALYRSGTVGPVAYDAFSKGAHMLMLPLVVGEKRG